MADRAYKLDAQLIKQRQEALGLSVDQLAYKAGVDRKTLQRWLGGRRALKANAEQLAMALGVTTERITGKAALEPQDSQLFEMNIKLGGRLSDASDPLAFTRATTALLRSLAENGVNVSHHQTNVNVHLLHDGEYTRTIVLVYGMFENGTRFWLYAAVRPSMYPLFVSNYKSGDIDLYNFEMYGEMLVFGEGDTPPDEATLKVAAMYQTTPAALMDGMNGIS
jgi:transcriptional regulator with XRE-family HTH domain